MKVYVAVLGTSYENEYILDINYKNEYILGAYSTIEAAITEAKKVFKANAGQDMETIPIEDYGIIGAMNIHEDMYWYVEMYIMDAPTEETILL